MRVFDWMLYFVEKPKGFRVKKENFGQFTEQNFGGNSLHVSKTEKGYGFSPDGLKLKQVKGYLLEGEFTRGHIFLKNKI